MLRLVSGAYFHPHPRPYSKDFQMGGSRDPAPGVGVGGRVPLSHPHEAQKLREYTTL